MKFRRSWRSCSPKPICSYLKVLRVRSTNVHFEVRLANVHAHLGSNFWIERYQVPSGERCEGTNIDYLLWYVNYRLKPILIILFIFVWNFIVDVQRVVVSLYSIFLTLFFISQILLLRTMKNQDRWEKKSIKKSTQHLRLYNIMEEIKTSYTFIGRISTVKILRFYKSKPYKT